MHNIKDYEHLSERELKRQLTQADADLILLRRRLQGDARANHAKYLARSERARDRQQKTVNRERRRFLDMVTKAGVSSSLLKASALASGVFANRWATAQDMTNMRVVYVYLNSGARNDSWLPSSASNMNIVTRPYGPDGYNVSSICNFR